MSIHKISSDLIRSQGPRGPRGSVSGTSEEPEEVQETARVRPPDRTEISAEGRELAARGVGEPEEISQSRLDELRDRIKDGFYDRPSIAEKLAERLHLDRIVEAQIR